MFQVNALAGSVPSSGSVPSPLNEITSPALKSAAVLRARGSSPSAGCRR